MSQSPNAKVLRWIGNTMECIDQKNLLSACQVSLQAMNPSVMKGDIDVGMYLESTLSSSDIVIGNAYPVPNAYISNQLQGDSYDLYGSDKLDPFELGDTSRSPYSKKQRYPTSRSTQWLSPVQASRTINGTAIMQIRFDAKPGSLSKFYKSINDQVVPADDQDLVECEYCHKKYGNIKRVQRHQKEFCRVLKAIIQRNSKAEAPKMASNNLSNTSSDAVVPDLELVCKLCNGVFKRRSNLVVHRRKKHYLP